MYRYKKIGYAALKVTNLERSVNWYRDLYGLAVTRVEAGVAYLRCSTDDHNLVLQEAAEPGLDRIAFQLESHADLERAAHELAGLGVTVKRVGADEAARIRQGETLRYEIPGVGLRIELYEQMAATDPFVPTVVQIERLGHVVVSLREARAAADWLIDHAGFRLSDQIGEHLRFLRAFPNPYHHSLAIAASNRDHLHHVNFMVKEIDDIGRAINRLKRAGIEVVYGPGRHLASGSIFLYFLDPDGMTVEYSFGMEEFPEIDPREAQKLPPRPETADLWGGVPANGSFEIGRIEGALR